MRGRTLRANPCVEEVDNRVNSLIFQWMTLWMTWGKPAVPWGNRT
jgi:hypothetical protein